MPLHRPRRIFRAQRLPTPSPGILGRLLAVGAIGVLGTAVAIVVSTPSDLFGRVPAPSGTIRAEPTDVAVIDGGTLRVGDSVVRLAGVEAPARTVMCHRPDGTSYDCGATAAARLADLVRGRAVTCELAGRDATGLVLARCAVPGRDINPLLAASLTDAASAKVARGAHTP